MGRQYKVISLPPYRAGRAGAEELSNGIILFDLLSDGCLFVLGKKNVPEHAFKISRVCSSVLINGAVRGAEAATHWYFLFLSVYPLVFFFALLFSF